jgi:hypothetical protein
MKRSKTPTAKITHAVVTAACSPPSVTDAAGAAVSFGVVHEASASALSRTATLRVTGGACLMATAT